MKPEVINHVIDKICSLGYRYEEGTGVCGFGQYVGNNSVLMVCSGKDKEELIVKFIKNFNKDICDKKTLERLEEIILTLKDEE